MKIFKQLIIAATATFASILPVQASNNSTIELTFTNTEIQCGSTQIEILANVYHNGTLIKRGLSVGDSILVPSVEGLSMTYESPNIRSTSCRLARPTQFHITNNSIPNWLPWLSSRSGAYEQASVASIINDLAEYEDLYLVELGTTDRRSPMFDLQDAIFIVNNNPTFAD